MTDLTAVVLTLNEERDIGRCLTSLSWCDHVIVVDSESSDRTVEIAKGLGARVYVHQQVGEYLISEQRNWAMNHCDIGSTWVLFIDADEVVTDDLAAQIRKVCRTNNRVVDGYQLTPKYLFWGTWMRRCMGYPNWHDRLVRRERAHFVGGVWEHFADGTRTSRITEPYIHYGNSRGLSDWLARHDRYSSWEAARIAEYLFKDSRTFGGANKVGIRRIAARLWPVRPLLRFIVMYFGRLGFLDGPAALVFCIRYAFYEYMIVEKVAELRRKRAGVPL